MGKESSSHKIMKHTNNIQPKEVLIGSLITIVGALGFMSISKFDLTLFGEYRVSYEMEKMLPTATPTIEPTPTPDFRYAPILEPISDAGLENMGVKKEYVGLVKRFGNDTGIGDKLAAGLLFTENRGQNPYAENVNYDGSRDFGLWQLNGIPEFDPEKNTDRAISILNNKKNHLYAFGYPNPEIGLLIRSYNMGAAGALMDNNGYDAKVFENAGLK